MSVQILLLRIVSGIKSKRRPTNVRLLVTLSFHQKFVCDAKMCEIYFLSGLSAHCAEKTYNAPPDFLVSQMPLPIPCPIHSTPAASRARLFGLRVPQY